MTEGDDAGDAEAEETAEFDGERADGERSDEAPDEGAGADGAVDGVVAAARSRRRKKARSRRSPTISAKRRNRRLPALWPISISRRRATSKFQCLTRHRPDGATARTSRAA